jgi:hypothetical protein
MRQQSYLHVRNTLLVVRLLLKANWYASLSL